MGRVREGYCPVPRQRLERGGKRSARQHGLSFDVDKEGFWQHTKSTRSAGRRHAAQLPGKSVGKRDELLKVQ